MVVGLLLVLYGVLTGMRASRHMWHDELYTYYIAKAATLSQLFSELRLDLNPPLEYLAVRASLAVFGDNSYAVRVPSLVCFWIGCYCLYRLISKRLSPVYGLLAVLLFWSTPFFPTYATEARPYALVTAWFGLTMLAWDETSKPKRSKFSVILLAATVTGMMFSHIFSVLYITPFCAAEAWRVYRRRKIDWAVWAALLVPAVFPFVFLRLVGHYSETQFPVAFQASPRRLGAFYYHFVVPELPVTILAFVVGLLLGFRPKPRRKNPEVRMSTSEVVFTLVVLAFPELVIAALMKTHGAFFPRYAMLFCFGYVFVITVALARYSDRSAWAAAAACGVMFLYDAYAIVPEYHLFRLDKDWPKQEAAIAQIRPDLPLVIASGVTFLEISQYSAPSTLQRLVLLTDRRLALKYAHATLFEGIPILKHYFPIRGATEPYSQFVAEHRQFLVFGTPEWPEDWLIPCLKDSHATVRQVGNFPGPYPDTQLFEVTMPAETGTGGTGN